MNKMFSLDSPLMRGLSRMGDLMLLNFYFLLTSIPIVTIGAACTALYSVTFRLGTDREEGVTASYFRAFGQNFRQGTGMWLLILPAGLISLVDLMYFFSRTGALRYLAFLFGFLFALVVVVAAYAFPLLSQFDNTVKMTLKNALILGVGYFPRTLVMGVLNLLPFALALMDIITFFQMGFFWFMFYFAAVALINTKLLRKVFAPFLPEEEETE